MDVWDDGVGVNLFFGEGGKEQVIAEDCDIAREFPYGIPRDGDP